MRRGDFTGRRFRTGREHGAVRVPDWAMAAFVMVGLHVLWLIWLAPAANRYAAPRTFPPRMTFLTHPAGDDPNGHARVLWSPILLSLPTPMGFSGAVRSDDPNVKPALDDPVGRAMYLERPDYESPWSERKWNAREGRSSTGPAALPPRELPVFQVVAPAPEPGLALRFGNGLSPDQFVATPWPDGPVEGGTGSSWELTARLIFDAAGERCTVLIEEPSGEPAVNRLAARVLRQWKVPPGADRVEGRVTLTYTGVQETPAEDPRETGR